MEELDGLLHLSVSQATRATDQSPPDWSGCEPDEFVATAPALCPDWLTSSTGRIPSATTSATRATAA